MPADIEEGEMGGMTDGVTAILAALGLAGVFSWRRGFVPAIAGVRPRNVHNVHIVHIVHSLD